MAMPLPLVAGVGEEGEEVGEEDEEEVGEEEVVEEVVWTYHGHAPASRGRGGHVRHDGRGQGDVAWGWEEKGIGNK